MPPALERPTWSEPEEPYLAFPKVTLHDHLDGSLRLDTMLDLADAQGVALPYDDPAPLGDWMARVITEPPEPYPHYRFAVTTSLMQDADSIVRVAREWVREAAADGVLYGEVRWAPEKHIACGLSMQDAVDAVAEGLRQGEAEVTAAGGTITARQLLCGMRETRLSAQVADVAIEKFGDSVVGFDIAGPEEGWSVLDHLEACVKLERAGIPYTIHAGESDGLRSVFDTVHTAHALRLGHGVRVIEDVSLNGVPLDVRTCVADVAAARAAGHAELTLGRVARWVIDRGIPLEVCLTSNSRHVVDGRENHPVDLLRELGFAVTINPDNRMMSRTSISSEMRHLQELFGWNVPEFADAQRIAVDASFLGKADRAALRIQVDTGIAAVTVPHAAAT
ncbi:adenosine deaminase [Promicromonospora sp. AC04]|uniref:adenosine deaminase family protein n=1 Tax=Promicromonospora sp. AC04 TaxID=2135723 RepID=UPI000D33AA77|nr:adenosine deaminase family protein [Promicromonospora sp. AC04]PUB21535.1 adenosine deaminase [Promicromonospora sp. AC04]